jgi:ABC-type siderophore export system fused ATPase/permease subunit
MERQHALGIHHRYKNEQDRHFVLGPLDLNIRGGEIIYVVGGNGSGKSTLAMIVLGLYRADKGEIRPEWFVAGRIQSPTVLPIFFGSAFKLSSI